MNKNSPDEDAINCIIVGTEHKTIYILDSEAFTILATVRHVFDVIKIENKLNEHQNKLKSGIHVWREYDLIYMGC